METFLNLRKPLMLKLKVESEERYEKRMEVTMDNICKEFHKGLNAFDLRVLEQPSPTIDLFSL